MSAAAVAAVLVGVGLSGLLTGFLLRGRERDPDLADLLDMAPVEDRELIRRVTGMADHVVERADRRAALAAAIERAAVSLRPGELVVIVAAGATAASALALIVTRQWLLAAGPILAAPPLTSSWLRRRAAQRRRRFEEELPDALSVVASSLAAGNTLLRSLQLLSEEADGPLAAELARVVSETQLGAAPVDALSSMAERVDVADLRWVVQAVRIQQEAGGKLADLLRTLADFVRAREEVRREVDVLTAEGRLTTIVLGGLPVFLVVAIEALDPGYLTPLFHGAGLFALVASALSVAAGVSLIRRMVRIEV